MKHSLAVLFVSLCFFGCGTKDPAPSETSGKLSASEPLVWDFGTVDIDTPFIEKTFLFENTSPQPLSLLGGNSSCGCTAGMIEFDGKKSSLFSMDFPLKEPIMIPANTDFNLLVRYEPGYHGPDAVGERTQTLYFISSSEQDENTPTRIYPLDGKSALTEIKLSGTIVKPESSPRS